jgi:hypothetical protein
MRIKSTDPAIKPINKPGPCCLPAFLIGVGLAFLETVVLMITFFY